jgi:hypothetical protein
MDKILYALQNNFFFFFSLKVHVVIVLAPLAGNVFSEIYSLLDMLLVWKELKHEKNSF